MAGPVTCDAGPLIAFAWTDCLQLLKQLFGEVWIPPAVRAECLAGDGIDRERIAASLQAGWLRTRAHSAKSTSLSPSLGPGETEALLLAQEHPKSLLIVDDRLAWRYALSRDIEIIGTVHLLRAAEREGMIEGAESVVATMRAAGYRISIDLLEQVRQRHQP